ncbi:MAG TPA: copper resistance protein CopC, partial [Ktedonobacteraceae bacterium]|nr:copper resistance protein CopC [Ktedonobacteraceae bacterium]
MISLLRSRVARQALLFALPLALCLMVLFPVTSEAHAILLRSDPAKDAVLTTAPDQVRMWFSEDLNPTFSSAVVVNVSNVRVDKNDAHVSSSDSKEMDLSLQPNLSPNVYVVVWRTQSADDGHVLRGSFIFKVAEPDGTVPNVQGTLPGQDQLGGGSPSTGAATGQLDGPSFFSFVMVTLVDLGVIFWMGAQLWRTFVLQLSDAQSPEQGAIDQSADRRFERVFSLPVLGMLLLANVGVLIGQGLTITGGNWGQVLSFSLLDGLVSNGRFGTYWTMREVVILLAFGLSLYTVLMLRLGRLPRFANTILPWINLVLGLALLIAVTLSGHAAATSSSILVYAVLADWLHLLAASLWIGGMMYLASVYLPVLKGRPLLERTRALLTTLPQFS